MNVFSGNDAPLPAPPARRVRARPAGSLLEHQQGVQPASGPLERLFPGAVRGALARKSVAGRRLCQYHPFGGVFGLVQNQIVPRFEPPLVQAPEELGHVFHFGRGRAVHGQAPGPGRGLRVALGVGESPVEQARAAIRVACTAGQEAPLPAASWQARHLTLVKLAVVAGFQIDDRFGRLVRVQGQTPLDGVRSAMPGTTAGRLCPNGIFVRPRMDHYREESRQVLRLVAETAAVLEQMSFDEAYIDMSALCQAEDADASLLRAVPLARELKQRIHSERRLTATIGVAANKLLAKIASDHQKPDGLTLISEKEKVQFLRPLPVRALYSVGKVTEGILNRAGVEMVGDLQDYDGDLRALVGSFGPTLRLQVKVRYGNFTTLTRQITVEDPLTEAKDIYRMGCFLLGRDQLVSRPLRLLGLGVASLREPSGQQLVLL